MKATELIAQLQKIIDEHGNLPLFFSEIYKGSTYAIPLRGAFREQIDEIDDNNHISTTVGVILR